MRFQSSMYSIQNKIISLTIIIIFLLTPFLSIALPLQSLPENQTDIIKKEPTKLHTLPTEKLSQLTTYQIQRKTISSFSNETEILPKTRFPLQSQPKLITQKDNIFVLAQTKNSNTSPGQLTATYSTDNGKTWIEQMTISHNITSFNNPSVDYTGDPAMQAYGSHTIDENTGTQLIFGFPNITNPNTDYKGSTADFDMYGWFNGRILTWDQTYWTDIGETATAGYPHGTNIAPYKNFHGLTIWPGHDGTGWSYYFFCETDETIDGSYKILWKNYLNGTINHVDIDIDQVTGWEYDLCELTNETTNKPEIQMDMLYLEPGNPTWYNDEENYGPSHIFKEYENPSLKASNGYVYLACEKNNDIYLHYSNDNGFSFSTTQLTTSEEIETQPQVTAKGNSVWITYIKNNNLYLITSKNAGLDWSTPTIINDDQNTISNQQNNVDLDGEKICWTTTNNTLIIDKLNIELPTLSIENISGGLSITATIYNSGTVEANNIPYRIRIDDGIMFSDQEENGTITIPAGESKSIQTTKLFFGLGSQTVTVQVGLTIKSVPATLFLAYFLL